MRLRNLCIDDIDYSWSVKKSDSGNILHIQRKQGKPTIIFVKDRNVTPKTVTKLIRRYINEKT